MAFKKVTPLDITVVVLFSLVSIAVVIVAYRATLYEAETVMVTTPTSEEVYSIHSNREIVTHGTLGDTLISISGGNVTITSSPCREKTCSNHPISKTGESLVCLPNGVVVQLLSISRRHKGEDIEVSF